MKELSVKICLELVDHEAIVLEWYRDSEGVGTWGVGVTNKSGHLVDRYKDKPSTVEKALAVFAWLLRTNYLPDVLKAFGEHELTEAQLAAALSFHYNTGRILTTDWVDLFCAGKPAEARHFLVNHYLNDGALKSRREAEAALFFDDVWSNNGRAMIFPVRKPSYQPDFRHGTRVDIRDDMAKALAS